MEEIVTKTKIVKINGEEREIKRLTFKGAMICARVIAGGLTQIAGQFAGLTQDELVDEKGRPRPEAQALFQNLAVQLIRMVTYAEDEMYALVADITGIHPSDVPGCDAREVLDVVEAFVEQEDLGDFLSRVMGMVMMIKKKYSDETAKPKQKKGQK